MRSRTSYAKLLVLVKIAMFLLLFCPPVIFAQSANPAVHIIPAPDSIRITPGHFLLTTATRILAQNPKSRAFVLIEDFLKRTLPYKNNAIPTNLKAGKAQTTVLLTTVGAEKLPLEGYKIQITPLKITVIGKGAGLFYGVQTLTQLFSPAEAGKIKLPCLTIEDKPRFAYRGMMLDVSRHFFTVTEVKQFLDRMALYKLNYFQWHLTDNQGWRIEIKKYPKLTAVGGYREPFFFGGNRDWFDGQTYGGFYTQEEIKEVVKYAADRYITVVPEIEMPGHSVAALNAYPELKCPLPEGSKQVGPYQTIYCPSDQTFNFLQDVLAEVIALFPGKYIHIGGDEANKLPWRESEFCQKMIKDLDLKNVEGLQSYFIQRIEKFVNSKGKRIIGWDEILEGGLAANATVMSWRGETGGIAAAKQKHKVIMSPGSSGLYFDYYQSGSPMEPFNYSGYAPINKMYNYDPVPKSLTDDEQQYILGVQGNIWTEGIATASKLEYMTLPRILALSEVGWSGLKHKNYSEFTQYRMPFHLARFDKSGYNYRVPPVFNYVDTTMIGEKFTLNLKSLVPGSKIYYTLNGRTPDDTDYQYTVPLNFDIPKGEKRELQTLVITPAGRRSVATRTILYNQNPLTGINYKANNKGLQFQVIKGEFSSVNQLQLINDLSSQNVSSGTIKTLNLTEIAPRNSSFGVAFDGYLKIDSAGVYNFYLSSNQSARLFIDDELVIDNEKPYRLERMGAVPLLTGYHKFKMLFINKNAASTLRLEMGAYPKKYPLAEELLFH
jgi:hexosaminidase